MSENGFHAEISKDEMGGWKWRIVRDEDGTTATKRGWKAIDYHEGLRGSNWTRWGARADARSSLRALRRFLDREEPEIVR